MNEWRLAVAAPGKMLTINAERRMHWAKRSAIVVSWRRAGWIEALAAKVPSFDTAEIDAYPAQSAGVLADPGAHAPVVKALVDGLVDAKVLPDDSPSYLRALRIHPPARGPAGVVLVIRATVTSESMQRA